MTNQTTATQNQPALYQIVDIALGNSAFFQGNTKEECQDEIRRREAQARRFNIPKGCMVARPMTAA